MGSTTLMRQGSAQLRRGIVTVILGTSVAGISQVNDGLLSGNHWPRNARARTFSAVTTSSRAELLGLLAVGAAVFVWSGLAPFDRTTWVLEIFPIVIAVPVLWATRNRFPLTPLVYRLILVHAVILMVGGRYTYARVPLGFWVQDLFGFARNHYDRLGHFAQGFVPALVAREILLRTSPLKAGKWLFVIVTAICLAISACYEFIEWWSALMGGEAATDFLGTQGDAWDTQWDMFIAFIGAMVAQITLSRVHDRALRAE
jgi:putative membrane protein